MAKRAAPTHQRLFNLDLESLLISDLSPESQNDSQTSSSVSCKAPKKFKTKDHKALPANKLKPDIDETINIQKEENEEIEEPYDVSKFFENVGNNFNKSLQVKKSRLEQFTDGVISIYQTKVTEMIKKHDTEIEALKEQTVTDIEKELNECEEEFKKLMQQENKLMKILEQQVKIVQKAAEAHSDWTDKFMKLHHNFVQAFEELKNKHKNETLDLKKSLMEDVTCLQNKFFTDSKKEEMETMKKYLKTIYF